MKVGDYYTDKYDKGEQSFKISQIIKANYDPVSKDNDIALVKVSMSKVTLIFNQFVKFCFGIQLQPVNGHCVLPNSAVGYDCLPNKARQFNERSLCYITGWGKQSSTGILVR